jgi:hypothetical protein
MESLMETSVVPNTQSNDSQQKTAVVCYNLLVEVDIKPIKVKYFYVTVEQLSEFTNISRIIELFLTLFGIASGAAISAWMTLQQGGLTTVTIATLKTAMWASAVVSIVFFLCSSLLYYHQGKHKSEWIVSSE